MHSVTRKNLLIWLIPTLSVAILVPFIIFLCFSKIGHHGVYDPDDNNGTKIAFHIGKLPVAWYGMFYFFGFTCAIFMGCFKMWKIYKIPIDPFYWYCLMGIPTSILGGRMGSAILGEAQWNQFFDFRGGGMAVEWGVALTVILGLIYFPLVLRNPKFQVRDEMGEPVSVRQVSMWLYCDAIVPTILIGQVIGRWGNYMNQEVYGSAINASGSWGHFVSNMFPYMTGVSGSDNMMEGVTYQPLFLIESFANFWGLILIYFALEFVPFKKAGDMGLLYFLWYGILRTSLEPLRDSGFNHHTSFVFSIVWIVIAATLLVLNHTLFIKMRKYYCWIIIWEWIRFIFTWDKKRIHNLIKNNEKKPQEMLYYFGR